MIRVLIAEQDPGRRAQWQTALGIDPEIEVVGLARDGQEAVPIAQLLRPDIILLAAGPPGPSEFEAAEMLAASEAAIQVIALAETEDRAQWQRAMRAGARAYLSGPSAPGQLLQTVHDLADAQQRRQTASAQGADSGSRAQIITVGGAKGGIGKTTLATNLAIALLQETGEPTALVDLHAQFGDVALLLNLTPRRALADLAALPPGEIDPTLLDAHLLTHESSLRVLPGAIDPAALEIFSVPFLKHLLCLLQDSYRHIVIDLPPVLHDSTRYALSQATTVVCVANLFDLTTVQDTRRLLDAVEGREVVREKIRLVLNRVSRRNRLLIADVERILGHSCAAQVPNDGQIVPGSVNAGAPFVLTQPRSLVSQSVRALARLLVGTACKSPPGSRHWLLRNNTTGERK